MKETSIAFGIFCIFLAASGAVGHTVVATFAVEPQNIRFLHGLLRSIAFGIIGIGLLLIPTAVRNLKS